MINEQMHICEKLDKNGVREDDYIVFEPFLGRKSRFKLNRSKIDFLSSNLVGRVQSNFLKSLDIISKEKLHVQLEIINTIGTNHAHKKRYKLKSLLGGPFYLNGCLVMEGFVERGDVCEIGHNKLTFIHPESVTSKSVQEKLLHSNLKLIQSSLPILIEGETGVGKTTLARKIHELSSSGPFIHINISAFSKNLIESELFGHVRGAFTGAMNDKKGALREAHLGTLFIDEIDSLTLELQTKLLLFLDNLSLRPVGGTVSHKVECRLIIASGQSLKELSLTGQMRKDFYYRISSGQSIRLPSLRESSALCRDFCQKYSMENNILISNKLIDFYSKLDWPGNLRQLKGHLNKKSILSNSKKIEFDECDQNLLKLAEVYMGTESRESTVEDSSLMKNVKYKHAINSYYSCDKNFTKTAKKLGISVKSLKTILGYAPDEIRLVA